MSRRYSGAPEPISRDVAAAALDQSLDMIVVLDDEATIILTNAAWRMGASSRAASLATTDCGVNYLGVCERSDAAAVADGVRSVLRGDRPRFEMDYPCHSALEDAWFALEVSALGAPLAGAVLRHTDITARVAAGQLFRPGRDVDPVTMLATSPTGVTGLARMLADAQAAENALAVLTVTLSDLGEIESRLGRRSRDDFVVQVLARLVRLTRADDVMIRASTNQFVLFARVADAQGGEFLRDSIAEVLAVAHLVGAVEIRGQVDVTVVSSDQFSTMDSLLQGSGVQAFVAPSPVVSEGVAGAEGHDGQQGAEAEAVRVPMVVYSLPDGFLQAANEAARTLFGLKELRSHGPNARTVADPIDLRGTSAALAELTSGTTDSYRAQRTLDTAQGQAAVLISVRRLIVGSGALAVALTAPVDPKATSMPVPADPFAVALVAGNVDANGTVTSLSVPESQMESQLIDALTGTLTQAVHPDDDHIVAMMLESMRLRDGASGAIRVAHAERGWVICQCQLFTINRQRNRDSSTSVASAGDDAHAFVLSVDVSAVPMADKIIRLERHIRRIGSEVHAADVQTTISPTAERLVSAGLDILELTARQREIVERLASGQRVSSIATALYVSRSTVRNHLSHVYKLVGVHSQEDLLRTLRAPLPKAGNRQLQANPPDV